MTGEDQTLQLLWPPDLALRGTETYAVLDAARDPLIHTIVPSSDATWRCLYAGALAPELRAVAPYLVHMPPHAPFARETVALGWGRAWGIWLVSAARFDDLCRHLRRLLRVQDETGRRLLFRFYDPVVLATVLPMCTTAELAEVFGPIDMFLVEASSGLALTELRFDGSALITTVRTADQPDGLGRC